MREEKPMSIKQTFKRAFGVILPLAILAILIAGAVISVANDIYAFVKKDFEVSLEISASESVDDIAKRLGKADVLENPHVFVLYVKSKGAEKKIDGYFGNITLNSNMSYRQILARFSEN